MPIPSTSGPYGLLPAGAHPCTLAEIEQAFVLAAPFTPQRQAIFSAFRVWLDAIGSLFPGARCWVDGGFVTHKGWAAPNDIDVAFFVRLADVAALDPAELALLETLVTRESPSGVRVQPMGGLVDGFMSYRDVPGQTLYWREFWARVKDSAGGEVQNVQKGFLEVIA